MEHDFSRLKYLEEWQVPKSWLSIKTLDVHTGGEPLRIITSGFPEISGRTVIEKRRFVREQYDHLRTALMWEPKGHADQYGAILTRPVLEDSDLGVLFLHNEGYSTMCGHAIIAITKFAFESGMFPAKDPVSPLKIDAPAGQISSFARITGGRVKSVWFQNVPSFVLLADKKVKVPGLGEISFDVAYGGAFYAFVNADLINLDMSAANYRALIETGMAVKHAVMENFKISHPFEEDLGFLYGTIFYGRPHRENADSRNVCIFAEGEVDRSPTGTGVSARMALHYSKGEIALDQPLIIESILGTRFTGRAIREVTFGPHSGVIPEVQGNAHIIGRSEFYIDPSDPLRDGFILR